MNELENQIEALKNKIIPEYGKTIDIDAGWYQIVIDCDRELTQIDPHYQIFQIKEKFGGLRYYFHPSQSDTSAKMYSVVRKYELIAAETCEATGRPGVLMKSFTGKYKTLNPEYAAVVPTYNQYKIVNIVR